MDSITFEVPGHIIQLAGGQIAEVTGAPTTGANKGEEA